MRAGALPPFPYRDLVGFTAFSVVLGTLVVQGLTLRPLLKALRMEDDGSVEREVRLARVETLRAALAATAQAPAADELSGLVRRRVKLVSSAHSHAGREPRVGAIAGRRRAAFRREVSRALHWFLGGKLWRGPGRAPSTWAPDRLPG